MTYVGTCALSLGMALLLYPAALSHIFKGYRGTEAVGAFADVSNTWDRLQFFAGLFDDYMMGGLTAPLLLVLCLLAITRWSFKKHRHQKIIVCSPPFVLLLTAVSGYFFTVSKTALLLGETSNRYELPVYGLLILLLVYGMHRMLPRKAASIVLSAAAVILVVLNLTGNKVFFLYPEEKEMQEFIKNNRDTPVVVLYNESSETHIWWLLDELSGFSDIYLAALGNEEPLSESESFRLMMQERFGDAKEATGKIVVYVADYENQRKRMQELLGAPSLSEQREEPDEENGTLEAWNMVKMIQKNMWTVYEIDLKL